MMRELSSQHRPTGALVSVVIPTYNRANLITDALDSIVAQTYRPIEIVVADDGSKDDTASVIERWRERPKNQTVALRYVVQENRGQNPARNFGILNATGEYVTFLDSDDCYLPEKIAKEMARMDDPEVGAVYCGIVNVDIATGEREVVRHAYPEGRLFRRLLVKDITNPTSTYLVRKAVLDHVGIYDEAMSGRTDWEMTLRMARHYKIAAVPEPLVEFRAHPGPRTAANRQREIEGFGYIRRKYAADVAALPFGERRLAHSAYYRRMGRVHLHGNLSRRKALTYYLAAVANGPSEFDNWAALAGFFMPKALRRGLHTRWNRQFGDTGFAIRSH